MARARQGTTSILQHADQIRKTFRSGKRTIIIDDRRYSLTAQRRIWKDPHNQERRKEAWIVVTPMDGKEGLPVASVEMVKGGNLRSVV